MRLSPPRFASFVNHLNLNFAHLRVYVPHRPHGDNERGHNDAILEDLVLGG